MGLGERRWFAVHRRGCTASPRSRSIVCGRRRLNARCSGIYGWGKGRETGDETQDVCREESKKVSLNNLEFLCEGYLLRHTFCLPLGSQALTFFYCRYTGWCSAFSRRPTNSNTPYAMQTASVVPKAWEVETKRRNRSYARDGPPLGPDLVPLIEDSFRVTKCTPCSTAVQIMHGHGHGHGHWRRRGRGRRPGPAPGHSLPHLLCLLRCSRSQGNRCRH
jgi:hypothetical protein